jgi:uncharacterized protein YndB with AHSA1/START domain
MAKQPSAKGADAPRLVKTVFLKAPPQHVWTFLTTADGLSKWFHDAPHDLKQGGDFVLNSNTYGKVGEKLCWGEVLEMKPYEKLVHTFTHEWLKGVVTTCTWTLVPVGNGTQLTLVHEGFDPDHFEELTGHDAGWDEHFVRLRRVTT